jgi:uncharacterized membrane protein YjgN (DUF898 family)
MTIQLNADNIRKGLLLVVYGAVIGLVIYGGFKYLPSFGKQQYAAIDADALISEYQRSIVTNAFINLAGAEAKESAQAEVERYYLKLQQAADRVAKRENVVIFDKAAIIAAPNRTIIDLTETLKRELANE